MKLMMLIKMLKAVIHNDSYFLEWFYYQSLLSELMSSLVTYLIYSKCWPDYTIYFMKYLWGFEVVILYKVFSVYNMCDTMTLALEVNSWHWIPVCTLKIPTFLRELYLYYFFLWNTAPSRFVEFDILSFYGNSHRTSGWKQGHAIHNFRGYVARHTLYLHRLDLD